MKSVAILAGLFLAAPVWAFDHSHAKWAEFLKAHVRVVNGVTSQVNYRAAATDRAALDAYVAQIEAVGKREYNGWTDDQKLAFLINAYNALTVKLILDNKIPKSIKDLGSIFRSPWKKKFFKFLDEESHLDRIEHEIARKNFNNCRLHFAFNCASIGCPMLCTEPFLAEKLSAQFESAARAFLADGTRNQYVPAKNTLEISKIFDWYGGDFTKDKTCGSVVKFIQTRMKLPPGQKIPDDAKVKYRDYDWNLNSTR